MIKSYEAQILGIFVLIAASAWPPKESFTFTFIWENGGLSRIRNAFTYWLILFLMLGVGFSGLLMAFGV